jgi:hypothetical protein
VHTEESIQVSAPSAVGERHFIESRKRKQGKVFSLKRYVACEKCNTGWMANFEGEMVKFAKPIFTSNDNIRLNERQIRIFSVWITLITILAEYLPANNVGPIISHEERQFVKTHLRHLTTGAFFIVLLRATIGRKNSGNIRAEYLSP